MMQRRIQDDEGLLIILPKDKTSNGFIQKLLSLLPFKINPSRFIEYDTRGPNDVYVVKINGVC